MAEIEVTCPSGLKGRIRGMKARDFRVFADQRAARSGVGTTQLVAACWCETTDPGVYQFDAGGKLSWDGVFLGDRSVAIVGLRRATYPGEPYAFKVSCQACRRSIDWELDLEQLPIKPMSEQTRAVLASGKNEFSTTVDGRRVSFKLLRGSDNAQQARLQMLLGPQVKGRVLSAVSRLLSVEGLVSPGAEELLEYIEDLGMAELTQLQAAFDEVDFGLITSIEVQCQWCEVVQEIELPFGKGFLAMEPAKKPAAPNPKPPSAA
jgi:hypothetical protein